MRVLFLPEVIDQFLELAEVLYDQGYFGFEDAAQSYAEQLFKEINEQLPLKVKRNAPEFFDRYGSNLFYSVFPRNQHTVWYIFYSVHEKDGEIVYLVRHLSNNHIIARHLDLE